MTVSESTHPRLARVVDAVPLLAGVLVVACGLLVLLGWTFDIEAFKSLLHPDNIAMNPATALCFLLCGGALLLLRREAQPGKTDWSHAAQIAAGFAVIIAVFRLVGYSQGWDFGPDRVLFLDKLGDNVMAPNTAMAFILIGVAIIIFEAHTQDNIHPAQGFILATGCIALLALTGYIYRSAALMGVSGYIPMALNTAICFGLLSAGLLCARPLRQPVVTLLDDSVGGIVARRLLPAAFLVPLTLGWLRLLGERRGWVSTEFGLSLLILSIIVVFNTLVWWNAQVQRRADRGRKRAEAELRQSEVRHRAVVEQASEGITLVDAQSLQIIEANHALAKMLGYQVEELIGRPVSDLIVDTEQGIQSRAAATVSAGGASIVYRQYRRKDGSIVDVEKSTTVLDLNGRPVLCTVLHDVTARKRAEEKLAAERSLLRALIDNLPDRINVKDLQGRYVLDNAAHLRQMGLTDTSQIIGKSVHDFYPPSIADGLDQQDKSVMTSGHPMIDHEESIQDHDGTQRWVLTTRVPIVGPDGQVSGMVGMTRDITERKRAEQLLADQHRQLEEAHRELKQAQSAMVQSEKLAGLGQMVAGVAHEINNPLAFVGNNVAVLQRDVKALAQLLAMYQQAESIIEKENAQLVADIRDLSERMDLAYTLKNLDEMLVRSREGLKRIQQIVKDLREFARRDAADLQDADLNAGMESTVNIVRVDAKKHQVALELQLSPLPPVACYPAKINQVVMNLVTNAIDACAESDGKVIVRTARNDGEIRIEVADNGSGIPPDVKARIFDPFFTTKPIGKGTGLGLSISYGIVQDHGGRIEVDSEMGKGTTFKVTLPARTTSRPDTAGGPKALSS
jgi:two-component system NtrC family sensor kinase